MAEKQENKDKQEDSEKVIVDINVNQKDNKFGKSKKKKNEEIETLKKKNEELKDKHLRLFADFDNFKKRTAKEKLELIQTAGREVITDILPILDDFERAMMSAQDAKDLNPVIEGMQLIYHKLDTTLKSKGLQCMESKGQAFNIEFHEAIAEVDAPSADMKGIILDEIEKGYLLNDKIIRFAKVVVGK